MPTFFVNKDRVDISASVPADTPLLWILRGAAIHEASKTLG